MKRLIISVCIIAAMIVIFSLHLFWLDRRINEITDLLSYARTVSYDLNISSDYISRAEDKYDRAEMILSITINEKQLDEVRMGFAKTKQSVKIKDKKQYLVELAGLKEAVSDLKESEILTLGNLF